MEPYIPAQGRGREDRVGDREQVFFEATGNKILLVNNKNYNVKAYPIKYDGTIMKETKVTKKTSESGKSPSRITGQHV